MSELKILSKSKSIESGPFTETAILEIISSISVGNNESDKETNIFLKNLLVNLNNKSSKHKFIVNLTKINSADLLDYDILNKFGAVWDEKRDGYINLKLSLDEYDKYYLVININWIYIG